MFRRKDGRYVATIQYEDQTGRTRRKDIYAKSEQEAFRLLRRFRRALDDGAVVDDGRLTLADLAHQWLEQEVKPRRRPATYRSYEAHVRNHIIPTLGHIRLSRLAPADVERMLNAKLQEGLSPRTVEYLRALVRRMLNRAERWGYVARNVAKLVDPPRQTRRLVEVPDPKSMTNLMADLREDRLWIAYLLALALGLRSGEIRGLRWEDVDFERSEIRIRQAMQRFDGKLQPAELKTQQSTRTLPMLQTVGDALLRHREFQQLEAAFAGDRWQDHGLVVTTSIGTPIDSSNLVHRFRQSQLKLGVKPMTIHQLRHACASFLISMGVDLTIVKEILGHSQISLTANTYAHIVPAARHDALLKMEPLLRGESVTAAPAAPIRPGQVRKEVPRKRRKQP